MIRDIVDSLMAGMLLSQLPVWELSGTVDKITMTISIAVLVFMAILKYKNEPQGGNP